MKVSVHSAFNVVKPYFSFFYITPFVCFCRYTKHTELVLGMMFWQFSVTFEKGGFRDGD